MILPAASTIAKAKEFGLSVSQLCGSNDLQLNYCPDPEIADIQALTPDGKAFLQLLVEERVKGLEAT
jgi:hypothetical protein